MSMFTCTGRGTHPPAEPERSGPERDQALQLRCPECGINKRLGARAVKRLFIVDLADTWEVALTTVRKALDALKAEGLVVTSPMGTFVAE